jgi:mevalonate kinase
MSSFKCQAFGKWILVGEHAVLRGCPALVFPIRTRSLELTYTETNEALEVELNGDHGVELKLLVWTVLDKACELKKIDKSVLKGTLHLESSLPVGAGMGASAALCVALVRWLGHLGYVQESEYYEFSRQLENIFHGESSGVDIAVALSGEGLQFVRDGARTPMTPAWKPKWYISYSGKRGVTLDAVNKVKNMLAQNPEQGQKVDALMKEAVQKAGEALRMPEQEGFGHLVKAISMAADCFEQWRLNDGEPQKHISWLKENGAVAVKPTGSGGGGYVLSLWKQTPPADVIDQLIPC